MKLEITKEWLEKRAALEGDSEIGAGLPTYVPPFIPSEADRYYGAIISKMQAALTYHTSALAERDARIAELEAANERLTAFVRSFKMTCVEGSFYKDCYLHLIEPDSVSFRLGNGSQFSTFIEQLEERRAALAKEKANA